MNNMSPLKTASKKKKPVKKAAKPFLCIPIKAYPTDLRISAACVQRGMKWLDEKKPNWYKNVNPAKLDMGNNKTCMLGQLFKDYFNVIIEQYNYSSYIVDPKKEEGMITHHEADEMGFDESSEHGTSYDSLAAVWFMEISNRKGVCKF